MIKIRNPGKNYNTTAINALKLKQRIIDKKIEVKNE